MKDAPLTVEIEGDELIIRIGIDTLSCAAEHCPLFFSYDTPRDPPFVKVIDRDELARDVIGALLHEKEDGSTPLSDLLDEAILHAYEEGSIAFEDDG